MQYFVLYLVIDISIIDSIIHVFLTPPFLYLIANGMMDGAHMRVTLTRGLKITSSMNPQFNVFGCTLVVLPEWKPVGSQATYDNTSGIKLITATNRRNGPSCVDSKIHHCNLINNSTWVLLVIVLVLIITSIT
jgi:hypothetical protein